MTLIQIQNAIRNLTSSDLAEFRRWFAEFDGLSWDAQLETDVNAGRLDDLAREALDDLRNGRYTDM